MAAASSSRYAAHTKEPMSSDVSEICGSSGSTRPDPSSSSILRASCPSPDIASAGHVAEPSQESSCRTAPDSPSAECTNCLTRLRIVPSSIFAATSPENLWRYSARPGGTRRVTASTAPGGLNWTSPSFKPSKEIIFGSKVRAAPLTPCRARSRRKATKSNTARSLRNRSRSHDTALGCIVAEPIKTSPTPYRAIVISPRQRHVSPTNSPIVVNSRKCSRVLRSSISTSRIRPATGPAPSPPCIIARRTVLNHASCSHCRIESSFIETTRKPPAASAVYPTANRRWYRHGTAADA
jgi:hypothetical protein